MGGVYHEKKKASGGGLRVGVAPKPRYCRQIKKLLTFLAGLIEACT